MFQNDNLRVMTKKESVNQNKSKLNENVFHLSGLSLNLLFPDSTNAEKVGGGGMKHISF